MIDLENYFERGFEVTQLDHTLISRLWQIVYTTEWIQEEDSEYKSIPNWLLANSVNCKTNEDGSNKHITDRIYGRHVLDNCPDHVINLAQDIINLKYFDTLRYFKKNPELKYINMWNGSEDISWHQDAIDGSDMLVLIYLTEEPVWEESWGGCISVRKELTNESRYETLVKPISGTMVVINNANPLVKHKVTSLKNQSVNRYTFSFCFNWLT